MTYDPTTLFRGTAWYYSRYRATYPASLFDHLWEEYQLGPDTRVVDVGAGTGQLAIPLAQRGVRVVAIDPEPEMLAEGREEAEEEGVAERITWVQGVGADLPALAQPPVRLCVFGASLHWMDRDLVLRHCDALVEREGGVAVISGGASTWAEGKPRWSDVVREVIQQFLGPQRRAGSGTYSHPSERHEVVLARSAFSNVKLWKGEVVVVRNVDEVIGLQYSTSYSSPQLLGDRKEEFERTLRERLLALHPENRFIEQYAIEALCARRP